MSAPDQLFLAFQEAVAGRYSLDRELGRGGMGVVYLAREVHLDRPVAIKLLPPERAADRTLRDRFLREARLAAKLSHPNIIPIFSVEESAGFVFFAMAFIDGMTLAHRVRTRGPLPATEGAKVLREVAWALAYAHDHGLVHRDVKPDNILLEEASGRVLVADFGIAAAAGDAQEQTSGTPEFMSPEQVLGTTLDARTDLYGLGATAFYMFSGRFPFEGKNATEILAKQVTAPAPSLTSLGLSVPRKIASLIDRCLSKSPDQRPENAKALAEQLGVALERRREMPPALRTFVKRGARLDGPGTLLGAGVLTTTTMIGAILSTGDLGYHTAGLIVLGATAAIAITAPFLAFVDAARHMLSQGFSHRDVGPAFDAQTEQTREELAVAQPERRIKGERVLAGLTIAGFSPGVVNAVALFFPDFSRWLSKTLGPMGVLGLEGLTPFAAAVGLFSFIGWVLLRNNRVTVEGEIEGSFFARLWKGRVGQAAFRIASKMVKDVRTSALTHQATELALGVAAEQLFESLPKETRKHLGDLPETLRHLEAAAQELRKRHDSLAEALSEAGGAASAPEYADVRSMRDDLHDRLGQAVSALEGIRLNLLRLHAGTLSVESMTTHLGIAADVADEVERLIAAHGEVDRALKFPRTPATTPV
jgi:predicted Ser/Thr protein kinase